MANPRAHPGDTVSLSSTDLPPTAGSPPHFWRVRSGNCSGAVVAGANNGPDQGWNVWAPELDNGVLWNTGGVSVIPQGVVLTVTIPLTAALGTYCVGIVAPNNDTPAGTTYTALLDIVAVPIWVDDPPNDPGSSIADDPICVGAWIEDRSCS